MWADERKEILWQYMAFLETRFEVQSSIENGGQTRKQFLFCSHIWMREWVNESSYPCILYLAVIYGTTVSAMDWKVGPAQIYLTGARFSPNSGKGGGWQVWWTILQPILGLQTEKLEKPFDFLAIFSEREPCWWNQNPWFWNLSNFIRNFRN